MKIAYTHHFGLPLDAVWKGIQDEEVLKKAIPGCQAFSQVEENVYHAEMGISVGPVKGMFTGQVRQADQEEPFFYRLFVKGKGAPGEIDAVAEMKLEEEDTGVKLTCTAEVQVTGVLASVGQRVMGGVAKLVIGQFFKTAEKEMGQMFSHS
ncbi:MULTISPECIES: CoxG family protein [Brevibacillus]|uniref:Carbon monoxide dehydrogenase subunit G n=1 Tax=Brevibacillus borstelensis AK1 TaxID=1300222 RepID=M8E2D4_9BACL|nr:carbon monoxide dehydrogenase subunit G [Brevibacillus borstelensis]EMT53441.1 carbon monoxide dehydrogenase subunit G [Brevibacillus borstelensis AK1]KKX53166.1 carbon monoxide dehydrogenase [Brevibacillus borstelensis cifa_chp40]MCM3471503.1 carbon monoxide dehydrogenase subunit G [Brevibacillus borstelensis]MCM3622383.1 carbon monoxide dehydrogenase subunit G [Brevibacillus borstelensis]MED1745377.1 carbon monoxide dehydrogenase subunit G [Brevibacillus borstelensis]